MDTRACERCPAYPMFPIPMPHLTVSDVTLLLKGNKWRPIKRVQLSWEGGIIVMEIRAGIIIAFLEWKLASSDPSSHSFIALHSWTDNNCDPFDSFILVQLLDGTPSSSSNGNSRFYFSTTRRMIRHSVCLVSCQFKQDVHLLRKIVTHPIGHLNEWRFICTFLATDCPRNNNTSCYYRPALHLNWNECARQSSNLRQKNWYNEQYKLMCGKKG